MSRNHGLMSPARVCFQWILEKSHIAAMRPRVSLLGGEQRECARMRLLWRPHSVAF